MKDVQSRVTNFFGVLFNMTVILLFAIFVVSYITTTPALKANMKLLRYEPKSEYKILFFEPNIDLTPHFTFNTKQIFLYVVLASPDKSEMVWSKTVRNGERYDLFVKERSNYVFTGSNVKKALFELRGNIYPYVGQMKDIHYGNLVVSNI